MKNLLLALTILWLAACAHENPEENSQSEPFQVEMMKLADGSDEVVDGENAADVGGSNVTEMDDVQAKGIIRSLMVALFDLDDNDELATVEKQAAFLAIRTCRIEAHIQLRQSFDGDGNGFLDLSERMQFRAARRDFRQSLRAQFDADVDGILSETERLALKTAVGQAIVSLLVGKYDSDGDGKISLTEATAEGLVPCQPLSAIL